MRRTLVEARSFSRPIQLLLINQFSINVGFYMLMPYLATYLAGPLGLAAWLVGFVLGVRNLSQQGLFLLGGSLGDRFGYKPMILAGLALRTVGFALLGIVEAVPALIVASALTGFAGALFNPAVRAYVALEAGERRVEAFAVFNVFYQLGILVGPLLGLALLTVDFRLVCTTAAVVFLALTLLQAKALPGRTSDPAGSGAAARSGPTGSIVHSWRTVVANRPFLLFSLAMIGSYVLTFQIYLGLPMEVRRVTGEETGVMLLFALPGLLTVVGQVRLTAWATARWTPAKAISRGLAVMGLSFLPLAVAVSVGGDRDASPDGPSLSLLTHVWALAPALAAALALAVGTMIVYPFEMATIVTLSGDRMIGTYYGLYNTLSGIGIAAGNLLTGAALDTGRTTGMPALPWLLLALAGGGCALAVSWLDRTGRLTAQRACPPADPGTAPTTQAPEQSEQIGPAPSTNDAPTHALQLGQTVSPNPPPPSVDR